VRKAVQAATITMVGQTMKKIVFKASMSRVYRHKELIAPVTVGANHDAMAANTAKKAAFEAYIDVYPSVFLTHHRSTASISTKKSQAAQSPKNPWTRQPMTAPAAQADQAKGAEHVRNRVRSQAHSPRAISRLVSCSDGKL
jgi:hypothetical protein